MLFVCSCYEKRDWINLESTAQFSNSYLSSLLGLFGFARVLIKRCGLHLHNDKSGSKGDIQRSLGADSMKLLA